MVGSNTLNSHNGESANSRADKMSGFPFKLNKAFKLFYVRKRRMFLKNPLNFDKI